MAKRIALTDYVELDGVDLSNFVHRVTFTSDDERIDVSGFNSTGASEFLAGTRVREVEMDVWIARGSNETHQVLYPLHKNRTEFDLVWRADGASNVGATNPELRGTVVLPSWSEGVSRGEADTATLTFVAADASDPLEFYST